MTQLEAIAKELAEIHTARGPDAAEEHFNAQCEAMENAGIGIPSSEVTAIREMVGKIVENGRKK